MTDTIKAWRYTIKVGVGVALAAVVALVTTRRNFGRIARAIAFFRRVSITTGKWLTFVDLLLWTAQNFYY